MNNVFLSNKTEFIFIGLGNPGREYIFTRHNIGFMCIDELAIRLNIKITRLKNHALIGSGAYQGHKITLVKPQTYMNLSGKAVGSLVKYFKVSLDNALIIHDDLDLPMGTIRLRASGSAGGQKGINSVIQSLGTEKFPRLRIGIGRPPGRMDPVNYVLQRFTIQEEEQLVDILERVYQACLTFMGQGIERTMSQFNQAKK